MVYKGLAIVAAALAALVALNFQLILKGKPNKRVWMTLLTNGDYLDGALTLDYSLKHHQSKYPLIVMHPQDIDQKVLDELHRRSIQTKPINMIFPATHKDYGIDTRFYDCWSKLLPHGMTEYDRVVELDADMLLLKNADELIEMPLERGSMAATHACVCNPRKFDHYPIDWVPESCAYTAQHGEPETAHLNEHTPQATFGLGILNGGLQVVDPNQKHFNDIMEILSNATLTDSFAFADQSLLSYYFGDKWTPLPYVYNALKTLRSVHEPIWRDDKVKIVHYILSDKPWKDMLKQDSEFEPNRWWWQMNELRLRREQIDVLRKEIDALVSQTKTVLFSKSYCPYCRNAKRILSEAGIKYRLIELDQRDDGQEMQVALSEKSGSRTVPQLFVYNKYIGGSSDLQRIADEEHGMKKLFA
ncbi:hypothetical protein PYCC9005_000727 [Savitreella phatthalungensis]